jgi:uncharacterized protein (DUF1800 family)
MRKQRERLMLWWLDRMVRADDQLRERMTWFWHGHFATSLRKVRVASLMRGQNQTLRRLGLGDFKPLAQAMIIDPAMLVWLDGNTAKAPNENLSREFMELFALGQGPYTESDVKQAARALTGWKVNRLNGSVWPPNRRFGTSCPYPGLPSRSTRTTSPHRNLKRSRL